MSLEDRIKHTGEHFLGSFDPSPDLQERISVRVETRARQRRQRSAAGLGAGVVVVLGGLVVLNVSADRDSGTTTASGGRPSVTSLMATTTISMIPTGPSGSRTDEESSAFGASTSPPSTPAGPAGTEFAIVAADAPTLLTAHADATTMRALDLATGHSADLPMDGTRDAEPTRTTSASGAFEYVLSPLPDDERTCGAQTLSVEQAGAEIASPLPSTVDDLVLSADGSTGVALVVDCTDPPTPGAPRQWARFSPDDPGAGLEPLDVPALDDISADGRYVAYSEGGRVTVVDLTTGQQVDTVPANCSGTSADADFGYLLGDDRFAALGVCDGVVSLMTGRLGGVPVIRKLDGCGHNAVVAIRPSEAGDPALDWFAVTDVDARQSWIVGPSAVSSPLPVDALVWWQPVGADTGS